MTVIIAAVMFGFTGVFSRFFYNERGIGPMEVTLIRVLVSAAVMLIVLGILAGGFYFWRTRHALKSVEKEVKGDIKSESKDEPKNEE